VSNRGPHTVTASGPTFWSRSIISLIFQPMPVFPIFHYVVSFSQFLELSLPAGPSNLGGTMRNPSNLEIFLFGPSNFDFSLYNIMPISNTDPYMTPLSAGTLGCQIGVPILYFINFARAKKLTIFILQMALQNFTTRKLKADFKNRDFNPKTEVLGYTRPSLVLSLSGGCTGCTGLNPHLVHVILERAGHREEPLRSEGALLYQGFSHVERVLNYSF